MEILKNAFSEGRSTLSEYESKQLLSTYGVPVTREHLAADEKEMLEAARRLGYPIVLKGCHGDLVHKSEKGVVSVDIRNDAEAKAAYTKIRNAMAGDGEVLVQEMFQGRRELVAGMIRDPQFGPSIMFGIGGILTEILNDVVFRIAPIDQRDAREMMSEIRGNGILNAVRGMSPVDRAQMSNILIALGQIGLDHPMIKEIDINPLIISEEGKAVAVDAMIGLNLEENIREAS